MTTRRSDDAPDTTYKRERAAPVERHLQTAIGTILIGLVFWVGTTLSTAQTAMAVLQARVTLLTEEVGKLRAKVEEGVDDRYRSTDARRDFGEVWTVIDQIRADHYRLIPPTP